jgi:hypothetical protein
MKAKHSTMPELHKDTDFTVPQSQLSQILFALLDNLPNVGFKLDEINMNAKVGDLCLET